MLSRVTFTNLPWANLNLERFAFWPWVRIWPLYFLKWNHRVTMAFERILEKGCSGNCWHLYWWQIECRDAIPACNKSFFMFLNHFTKTNAFTINSEIIWQESTERDLKRPNLTIKSAKRNVIFAPKNVNVFVSISYFKITPLLAGRRPGLKPQPKA